MVKKIIFSGIVLCLFIAIPLALMGYKQVELGTPFLALMRSVSRDLDSFKIEIPDIPKIPKFSSQEASGVLEVLFNILNAIINFFNVIIFLINTVADVVNIIIQLIQVIVLIVKNLITFKDSIAAYNPLIV